MDDAANELVLSLLPRVRRQVASTARTARKRSLRFDRDECESLCLYRLTRAIRRHPNLVADRERHRNLFGTVIFRAAQKYLGQLSEPGYAAGDYPLFSEVSDSVEELERIGKEPDPADLDWDGGDGLPFSTAFRAKYGRWVAAFLASGIDKPAEFARLRDGNLAVWQNRVRPALKREFARLNLGRRPAEAAA